MPDGLNKVMLIGNLGKDPEMRYTANGNAVTNFTMAVSRSFAGAEGRREETEWFTIVAWNKLAEIRRSIRPEGPQSIRRGTADDQKLGRSGRTEALQDRGRRRSGAPPGPARRGDIP